MKHYNHIIVGQGLAGSILALELIKNGKSVLVIDKPELSSSSKVAAGIWNPVVFKRLTKSWLADKIVPVLLDFYTDAEKTLNCNFLDEKKIVKLFTEEQEVTLWKKKAADEMALYLDPAIFTLHQPIESEAGFVLRTGNINTCKFMNAVRDYLTRLDCFFEEKFIYGDLIVNKGSVSYKGFSADSVVFCEGYLMKNNPYFNYIPIKPAKGDVLTIKCKDLDIDFILNKGMFIMPLGNYLFKVGATYDWEDLTDRPSEKGKQELIGKLNKIISYNYEVIKHEAGVRPSTVDRRPVVGEHAIHKNIQIFNGFGTKAVMLAPYFAKQFVSFLNGESNLDKEVDCKRFKQD